MKKKNCSKCGKKYPESPNFFRKAKTCKNGLSNTCKKCFADYKKQWRIKNNKYKKGPRNPIAYNVRIKEDSFLRTAKILRQGILLRGKSKGIDIDDILDVDYFYNRLLLNDRCDCCKIKLDLSFKRKLNSKSPTIDRVDNNKGYSVSNIAILCFKCNAIKKDSSLRELKLILNWMKNAQL